MATTKKIELPKIGIGSFSEIFEAFDPKTNALAALKAESVHQDEQVMIWIFSSLYYISLIKSNQV